MWEVRVERGKRVLWCRAGDGRWHPVTETPALIDAALKLMGR